MKSCPTCQQLYSDALEVCPNDGATLMNSSLGYTPGSSGSYKWQSGQAQGSYYQQQPPPGYGYYPPPGMYPPPYGAGYPPQQGGGGLATAALWTGISTAACIAFGYLLIFVGASSMRSSYYDGGYPRYYGPPPSMVFGGILIFLSFIVGLTALILGIVAASMSSRNPNISKAKAIVGLCLGAIPYLLLIIGLVAGASMTGGFR